VILTVPSKFLLPSPVKLCGTEVKAAKTGRLNRGNESELGYDCTKCVQV
jgi:hypothetical protein